MHGPPKGQERQQSSQQAEAWSGTWQQQQLHRKTSDTPGRPSLKAAENLAGNGADARDLAGEAHPDLPLMLMERDSSRSKRGMQKKQGDQCLNAGLIQFGWFGLSNLIGCVFLAIFYTLIYTHLSRQDYDPALRANLSWSLGNLGSIPFQHFLNIRFVFLPLPGSRVSYLRSLFNSLPSYGASLLISSSVNHLMLSSLGMQHQVAWVVTLVTTGMVSYCTLKLSIVDWESGDMPQEKELHKV